MEKNKVMREIKFRAKDTLERSWYVGSYIFTDDNTNNPFRSRPFKESHRIIFYSSGDWNMGGWSDVEIDPSTLGQYTGLRDKNGNEIYEGDIVCFDDTPYCAYGNKYQGVVVIHRGAWRVKHYKKCFDEYFYSPLFVDDFASKKTTILGNVYDNPELINKEE